MPPRMDKTAFAIVGSFDETLRERRAHWRAKRPAERMAALEFLRSQRYPHGTAPRLRRVLEVLER